MLTKSVKYTHQLAHWVNAVRTGNPGEVVSSSYYSHPLANERPSQEDLINRLKTISFHTVTPVLMTPATSHTVCMRHLCDTNILI